MKKFWIVAVVIVALLAITIVAFASSATQTKCHDFYNGATKAARFCRTQTLSWASTSPYAVSCGSGSSSWAVYNGYTLTDKKSGCTDYGTYVQYKTSADIKRPNGTLFYNDAVLFGTTRDGQVGTFKWQWYP